MFCMANPHNQVFTLLLYGVTASDQYVHGDGAAALRQPVNDCAGVGTGRLDSLTVTADQLGKQTVEDR